MTDADRVRLATSSGRLLLGPCERQRCAKHPRRWEIYRWRWPVDAGPDAGDVEVVRSCLACSEEEES